MLSWYEGVGTRYFKLLLSFYLLINCSLLKFSLDQLLFFGLLALFFKLLSLLLVRLVFLILLELADYLLREFTFREYFHLLLIWNFWSHFVTFFRKRWVTNIYLGKNLFIFILIDDVSFLGNVNKSLDFILICQLRRAGLLTR